MTDEERAKKAEREEAQRKEEEEKRRKEKEMKRREKERAEEKMREKAAESKRLKELRENERLEREAKRKEQKERNRREIEERRKRKEEDERLKKEAEERRMREEEERMRVEVEERRRKESEEEEERRRKEAEGQSKDDEKEEENDRTSKSRLSDRAAAGSLVPCPSTPVLRTHVCTALRRTVSEERRRVATETPCVDVVGAAYECKTFTLYDKKVLLFGIATGPVENVVEFIRKIKAAFYELVPETPLEKDFDISDEVIAKVCLLVCLFAYCYI